MWGYVDGAPLQNDWPSMGERAGSDAVSERVSKDLKKGRVPLLRADHSPTPGAGDGSGERPHHHLPPPRPVAPAPEYPPVARLRAGRFAHHRRLWSRRRCFVIGNFDRDGPRTPQLRQQDVGEVIVLAHQERPVLGHAADDMWAGCGANSH